MTIKHLSDRIVIVPNVPTQWEENTVDVQGIQLITV